MIILAHVTSAPFRLCLLPHIIRDVELSLHGVVGLPGLELSVGGARGGCWGCEVRGEVGVEVGVAAG